MTFAAAPRRSRFCWMRNQACGDLGRQRPAAAARRPIGHDVDAAFQRPARLARAMAPAPSGFIHRIESSRVEGFHTALGPGRAQAHLFPLPRAWLLAFATRWLCANHGPISFGHHIGGTRLGKNAKALLIAGLQPRCSPPGVLQGDVAHCRGVELKSIMLFEALAALPEGMLGPEIAQHSLQPAGFATRADPRPAREGS